MKKQKQVFKCNLKGCTNETKHSMPDVAWLQVEIIECSQCKRLIAFSTLYKPKGFSGKYVSLP